MNEIFGFVTSFVANFICRTCKISKEELHRACKESLHLLRNENNYETDINNEPNEETRISLCGIKKESILNKIENYHVTENFAHDIMHDMFEGVCVYTVSQVLFKLIQDGLFTISELNSRKDGFHYDLSESGNLSKQITMSNLQRGVLKMSAREMWTFVHFLPLMIGNKIPRGNKWWKLICILVEIIDLLLLPRFDEQDLKTLSIKIESHHKLYISLFGSTLKPKFHYFLHYENMIRKLGPAKFYWCFRFESKHRQLKEYCKNVNSRVNIAKSLAIKCCLNFSQRISGECGFSKTIKISKMSYEDIFNNKYYFFNLKSSFEDKKYKFYSFVEYCGFLYKQNTFLTKTTDEKRTIIYEIKDIIQEEDKIYIVGLQYLYVKFDHHYQSYLINNSTGNFYLINVSEFDGPPTNLHLIDNNKFIRKKLF